MVSQRLREAITAVQAGNRSQARALLLALLEEEPHNEMAWLWLSDVLEQPEERIVALENALAINPQRVQTRRRLAQVRQLAISENGRQPQTAVAEAAKETGVQDARQARYLALIQQVQQAPEDAAAWFALSQIVDSIEDQIIFLEEAIAQNPSHRTAQIRLTQLLLARQDEIALGKAYEAHNRLHQAAHVYRMATRHGGSSVDGVIAQKRLREVEARLRAQRRQLAFTPPPLPVANHAMAKGRAAEECGDWAQAIAAYSVAVQTAETAQIRALAQTRLETAVRQQKLPPVKLASPTSTLWRLGVGPVLLYLILLTLHSGLNPLRLHWLLLIGTASALAGGMLLVAVTILPHHTVGKKLLGADGHTDIFSRTIFGVLGALLILWPFSLLLLNAIQRLAVYTPTIPFIW